MRTFKVYPQNRIRFFSLFVSSFQVIANNQHYLIGLQSNHLIKSSKQLRLLLNVPSILKAIYELGLPFHESQQENSTLFVYALFILQSIILIALVIEMFLNRKTKFFKLLQKIVFYFFMLNTRLFYIPSIYYPIQTLVTLKNQDNVQLGQIISVFLLLIQTLLITMELYFIRIDRIYDNNPLRTLQITGILNFIQKILTFLTVIFNFIEIQIYIKYIFMFIIWIIQIFHSSYHPQYFHQVDIFFALSSIIGTVIIYFNDNFVSWAILLSLSFPVILKLIDVKKNQIIINPNENSTSQMIQFCQLYLYYEEKVKFDVKAKLKLLICKNIHRRSCSICSENQFTLVNCILSQLRNRKKDDIEISLYLVYEKFEKHSLSALLLLFNGIKNNGLYHHGAVKNLKYQLQLNIKKENKQNHDDNQKQSLNMEFSLSISQIQKTLGMPNQVLDIFIKTINGKINFWSKMLAGYHQIKQFYTDTLIMTNYLIECKQYISNRYNLLNLSLINNKSQDIISLKLLQIYYSAIYTNQMVSLKIEKEIYDCLKNDVQLKHETLNNTALFEDRIIILKTSLVNNQNELINIRDEKIQILFNQIREPGMHQFDIKQLMPKFIQLIHDQIVENYIERGTSKLFNQGRFTFFKTSQYFIQPCYINLCQNYQSLSSDFILSLVLQIVSNSYQYIVFNTEGKIIGVSEKIFNFFMKNRQTQNIYSVQDYLNKAYIQFYIEDIYLFIKALKNKILKDKQQQLSEQKTIYSIPQNQNLLFMEHNQFQQQQRNNFQKIINQKEIYGIPIPISSKKIQKLQYKFLEKITDKSQKFIQLQFNLLFHAIDYGKGKYGYFIMQILEHQYLEQKHTTQTFKNQFETEDDYNTNYQTLDISVINFLYILKTQQKKQAKYQDNFTDQKEANFWNESGSIPSDKQISAIQLYQQMKNYYFISVQNQQESDPKQKSYPINDGGGNSRQSKEIIQSNYESFRNLYKPSIFTVIQKDYQGNIEQDLIDDETKKPQITKQIYNDQEDDDQNKNIIRDISSKSYQKSRDFAKIIDNPKNNQIEQHSSTQTHSSFSSQESLIIISEVTEKKQINKPLIYYISINIVIDILILTSIFLNVALISTQLDEQVSLISSLNDPLNVQTSCIQSIYNQWIQIESFNGLIQLSPFLLNIRMNRSLELQQYMFQTTLEQQQRIIQKADQINYKLIPTIIYDAQNLKTELELGLVQFYSIFLDRLLQAVVRNNSWPLYKILEQKQQLLISNSFLRQNLLTFIGVNSDLIQFILSQVQTQKMQIQSYFLILALFEFFLLILLFMILIRLTLFMDKLKKQILMIISRITNTQAYDQIARMSSIRDMIKESKDVWMHTNFTHIMFEKDISKQKKMKKKIEQNTKTVTLNMKIYNTRFKSYSQIFTKIVIVLTFGLFLFGGYILHMNQNNDFEPAIELDLELINFKFSLDTSLILGELIKSEHHINTTIIEQLPQKETILKFQEYQQFATSSTQKIIEQLVTPTSDVYKSFEKQFKQLWNDDLCNTYSNFLPFCNLTNIHDAYSPSDNYREFIMNGLQGLLANFEELVNTEFFFEIQEKKYITTKNETIQFLNSKPHRNIFTTYFVYITYAVNETIYEFQKTNGLIAETIKQNIQIYYYTAGIFLLALFRLFMIFLTTTEYQTIVSLLQSLTTIPIELINSNQITKQIKSIKNDLF